MFITKKNYEKALAEREAKLNLEWYRKWAERDEQYWRVKSEEDFRDEMRRRFGLIETRVRELEKKAGLVEEKPSCPFEVKTANY